MKLTEHQVQAQILDWLKLKRIFHWRNNTGAHSGQHKGKKWFVRYGVPGAPDIFCVVNGRAIGIEVKAQGKLQSVEQASWEAKFREAGGAYLLTWSLDHVIAFFGKAI